MRRRNLAVAAGALLAACGSADRSAPVAERPKQRALAAAPVAATRSAQASPTPSPSASPSPSPAPSAPGPSPSPAPLATYPPRDECAKLPGFAAFREAVFAAARKKDVEALVALADPDIRLDFGGGAGPEELKKRLSETRPELWAELAALGALGCAADGTVATMPWIFSRMPDKVDAYRGMLVTGEKVPLRAAAAADAKVVRELDWALVALAGEAFDPKAKFAEVTTEDGTKGFVEGAKLRSLLDYRLIADREDGPEGAWRITAFIAGD